MIYLEEVWRISICEFFTITAVDAVMQKKFVEFQKFPENHLTTTRFFAIIYVLRNNGVWLSLVERLVRDQEAGSSNLLTPTKISRNAQ